MSNVPKNLVDANIDALQTSAKMRNGVKSVVPRSLLAGEGYSYVQGELSQGRTLLAGRKGAETIDKFGEKVGVLEAECVGGVEEAAGFMVDLSTCAEEI